MRARRKSASRIRLTSTTARPMRKRSWRRADGVSSGGGVARDQRLRAAQACPVDQSGQPRAQPLQERDGVRRIRIVLQQDEVADGVAVARDEEARDLADGRSIPGPTTPATPGCLAGLFLRSP